jgi:hypothetical protein
MGRFEDQLLDRLLCEHGQALAAAERPAGEAPKRHWGRWAAAVGTVAAVVAGFVVVQSVSFGNAPVATAAAAEVLNKAADRIGASDPVVAPGQYLYIETHRWDMATIEGDGRMVSYLQESMTQTWVPHDRTQEWLQRSYATGKREWLQGNEADLRAMGIDPDDRSVEEVRARCGDFYPEGGMQPCEWEGSWQNPTPEFVAELPSDPHELYEELLDVAEEDGDDAATTVLGFVDDAIQRGLMPASLRANLYRALAFVPELEISDQNANLDGRVGIGLGVDKNGWREELIIDPETGQFIGGRTTTTRAMGQTPAGTVVSYSSLSTAVVDRMGTEPGQ